MAGTRYFYQASVPDIKRGNYSAKVSKHTIKKMIITDAHGCPLFISPSFEGRPHDMQICRFPEVSRMLNFLNNESQNTGEYGLGDNAFSAIKTDMVNNFIFTPREDCEQHRMEANYYAKVRYAVETINASCENFKALSDKIRLSPSKSMDRLLSIHHYITCICMWSSMNASMIILQMSQVHLANINFDLKIKG